MKIVKILTIATVSNAWTLTHWNYTYDGEVGSGDYESFYDMCGYECDYHSLTTTSEPEITTTTEQQSNGCVDKHIVCLQLQDKCTTEEIVWDSCQKTCNSCEN